MPLLGCLKYYPLPSTPCWNEMGKDLPFCCRCCTWWCRVCVLMVAGGWGLQEREEERERSTTCQWQLNPKSRELLAAKGRLSQDGDIVSRLMEHGTQQRLKVRCSLANL